MATKYYEISFDLLHFGKVENEGY